MDFYRQLVQFSLELGDFCAKPKRKRDPMGHTLQLPIRFPDRTHDIECDDWFFQERFAHDGRDHGPCTNWRAFTHTL
jgi:hypothetical protein